MKIKIQYHFSDDPPDQNHTCIMTDKQYDNFRMLPVVDDCKVLEESIGYYEEDSQSIESALMAVLQKDEYVSRIKT